MQSFQKYLRSIVESVEGSEGSEVDDGDGYPVGGPTFKKGEPEMTGVREDAPAVNAFQIYNYPEDDNEDPLDRLDRLQYGTAAVEQKEEVSHGTYSYFPLSRKSSEMLHAWSLSRGIPNPTQIDHYHSTAIWCGQQLPQYQPYRGNIVIEPETFNLGFLGTPDKPALVLFYHHPIPYAQWQQAKDLGAVFTYPKYIPHITLSYDPMDIDVSSIGIPYMELTFEPERIESLDPEKFKKEEMNHNFERFIQ